LYGDHFKVLEERKKWSRIRISYDQYEGWINNKQFTIITEEAFQTIEKLETTRYSADLVSSICTQKDILIPIALGSSIHNLTLLSHRYEGNSIEGVMEKSNLIETAVLYVNAPYLWGGKTPFGIDCSGFTQMVHKINGYKLARNAVHQSEQGTALSFIEESEPGDLAFFDNSEGVIDHVGIIMQNNHIIHSYGKVRIDRLDHTGIFNNEIGNYTHKLRVIKKII
ncbi:MAG: C40 family peptidase, partial [Bacteroidota bacterium]